MIGVRGFAWRFMTEGPKVGCPVSAQFSGLGLVEGLYGSRSKFGKQGCICQQEIQLGHITLQEKRRLLPGNWNLKTGSKPSSDLKSEIKKLQTDPWSGGKDAGVFHKANTKAAMTGGLVVAKWQLELSYFCPGLSST